MTVHPVEVPSRSSFFCVGCTCRWFPWRRPRESRRGKRRPVFGVPAQRPRGARGSGGSAQPVPARLRVQQKSSVLRARLPGKAAAPPKTRAPWACGPFPALRLHHDRECFIGHGHCAPPDRDLILYACPRGQGSRPLCPTQVASCDPFANSVRGLRGDQVDSFVLSCTPQACRACPPADPQHVPAR